MSVCLCVASSCHTNTLCAVRNDDNARRTQNHFGDFHKDFIRASAEPRDLLPNDVDAAAHATATQRNVLPGTRASSLSLSNVFALIKFL